MARAEKLVWHSLALALIGFLFFLLMCLVFGELLLVFLGGQGAILEQSQTFCLILFSGGLFLWLMSIAGAIFRGMGDMKFPAVLMIMSAFIQVPLSGALVLGGLGLPQLGITGAVVSAIVSSILVSTLMLIGLI